MQCRAICSSACYLSENKTPATAAARCRADDERRRSEQSSRDVAPAHQDGKDMTDVPDAADDTHFSENTDLDSSQLANSNNGNKEEVIWAAYT